MTIEQLKKLPKAELEREIRARVGKINESISSNPELKKSFAVQQTITRLQSVGARGRGDNPIGLGFSKNRPIESYVRQLRELEWAEPLITDYEGVEYLDERYKQAKDSFLNSLEFEGKSENEWRDVVETFGVLGQEIVEKFDSASIANQFSENTREIDMVKLMLEVYEDSKGEHLTKDQITNKFILRLEKEIGKLDKKVKK